jgi:heme/copper-type cytochrome/quinol oxidase subunit 2
VYSEDSSICKSSEHSGVNLKGMRFKVIVERFRNMYESSIKNTIQSEYKITNTGSKSMSFEVIKDDSLV